MTKQLVPVIGVFYNESDYLNDWLECVVSQCNGEITALPIIVTNHEAIELSLIHISEPTRPY